MENIEKEILKCVEKNIDYPYEISFKKSYKGKDEILSNLEKKAILWLVSEAVRQKSFIVHFNKAELCKEIGEMDQKIDDFLINILKNTFLIKHKTGTLMTCLAGMICKEKKEKGGEFMIGLEKLFVPIMILSKIFNKKETEALRKSYKVLKGKGIKTKNKEYQEIAGIGFKRLLGIE